MIRVLQASATPWSLIDPLRRREVKAPCERRRRSCAFGFKTQPSGTQPHIRVKADWAGSRGEGWQQLTGDLAASARERDKETKRRCYKRATKTNSLQATLIVTCREKREKHGREDGGQAGPRPTTARWGQAAFTQACPAILASQPQQHVHAPKAGTIPGRILGRSSCLGLGICVATS